MRPILISAPEQPRTQPAKLSWQKKLAFAFVPLCALVLLAEIACRIVPYKDPIPSAQPIHIMSDEDLIWRLKPEAEGSYKTNDLGLRDTPFNPEADIKILLLGDSVGWGANIDDLKFCFPYQLEKKLNELNAPISYEVINAGVPGYATFQEAIYFRRDGLKFNPDLVMLQICLNDITYPYLFLAEFGGNNLFRGIETRNRIRGVYGFLIRHSRVFERTIRLLQRQGRRREVYDVQKLTRDELSWELIEAWEDTFSEIDKIRNTAAAHGISLMLVIAPYQFQLDDPDGLRQPQDRILAYARKHRLACIDLLPGLAEATGLQPLFNDDSHFSEFGHYQVSDLLVGPVQEALRARGKVSVAAQPKANE